MPQNTGSKSRKEELKEKYDKLEVKREGLVQSLKKAYDKTDEIKKKIQELDRTIHQTSNELKRC